MIVTGKHDFCVDASAVLSAYGLRDCGDLDFLHLNNLGYLAPSISCHNKEIRFYTVPKNDVIYDPRLHFYCHGVKFASLGIIREMKKNRDEHKDRIDVKLIEGVI